MNPQPLARFSSRAPYYHSSHLYYLRAVLDAIYFWGN